MLYSGWTPPSSCSTAAQKVAEAGCPSVNWFWVAAAIAVVAAMSSKRTPARRARR